MSNNIVDRETELEARLLKIKAMEEEILLREKNLKKSEAAKKQIVLRLSPTLWNDVAEWAESDFRSINGQIEFILSEAVKKRKRNFGD